MPEPTIADIRCRVLQISDKTDWTLLEVTCSDGSLGLGEATVVGDGAVLKACADAFQTSLIGTPALPATMHAHPFDGLHQRAVISALEQALWDALGHRLGVPVTTLLGGAWRDAVPVYANINRRTLNRSPEGFAASAQAALDAGYAFVKMAPFDGVGAQARPDQKRLMDAGFARIEAVCGVMPSAAHVLVDCHWRFDDAGAFQALNRGAEMGLYWLECLVPETPEDYQTMRRLHDAARLHGLRLAGLEMLLRPEEFTPHLDGRHYDVIMPDVKYVGGLTATLQTATLAASRGVHTAPHNPSGPICHAASLAVSAVIPDLLALEVQFDESPYFNSLVNQSFKVTNGHMSRLSGPGLGVSLNADAVAEVEVI